MAKALARMRDRIADQLGHDPTELQATGQSMRLAELLNYLRRHLIEHALT